MSAAFSLGLRSRLILGVLLASLPAILTLLQLAETEREGASEQARRETLIAAQSVAREHRALVQATREVLVALAQVPEIRGGRGLACNALLSRIKSQSAPWYVNFIVVQPDGEVGCAAAPALSPGDAAGVEVFKDALAAGEFTAGHYHLRAGGRVPTLAVAYPEMDGGELVAMVQAILDLSWLERHPQWLSLPEGATLLVIDRAGKVLLRAPALPPALGRNLVDTELGRLALSKGGPDTFVASGLDGESRLYGRARLGFADQEQGLVLIGLPYDAITAGAEARHLQALAGLAVTLALTAALGWAAIEFLVLRALSPVLSTVRSVAEGDFSARTGVASGTGEIHRVARAVDAMAETLEAQRDDSRRAEAARRDSEARLQAIFDGLADAVVFADTERRIRLVNPAFTTIFGYTPEEVLGRNTAFLYADPQDYAELGQRRFQPRGQVESTPYQMRYRRKNGSEFWSESVGVRIVGEDGEVIGFLGLHRDISARRWAEQALRESEARLRLAARVARFGIFEHDHAADMIMLSPEMREMTDLGESDHAGLAEFADRIPPVDRERVLAAITRAHDPAGDGLYEMEHRFVHRNGEVRWLSVRAQTVFEGEGADRHAARTIGAVFDITERRRAEERFRRVVEAAPSAIVLVNVEGRIGLVNAQVEKLFGYRRAELLDQPVEILLPKRFRGEHSGLRASFHARPSSRVMGEGRDLYGLHRDGHEIPLEIGLSPIQTEEGMLVMAFIADITRRKEAEEAVLRLNAELERRVDERTAELVAANRELDSFAYAVSHDLRAPLRALSGFSQALLEDFAPQLDDDARVYLKQIDIASRRMGDLVDGLLALSRSTRGELQRDQVDISAICERLLAELRRLEPDRRARSEVEPGLVARADARMVEAVLGNLLGNAWKYTAGRDEAEIRVYAQRDGSEVCFCVADNGAGFDMAYAGKLFQPFQRLHRQDEFPGLGIGLATAQRIVHRHGGEICARGEAGVGARFCFSLAGEGGDTEDTEEDR